MITKKNIKKTQLCKICFVNVAKATYIKNQSLKKAKTLNKKNDDERRSEVWAIEKPKRERKAKHLKLAKS